MSNQAEQLRNDLRLIQEVERHTNLYDPRCKDKDSKSRENTWSVIGKKLNLAPDACKNRWKNLRDKYTREKKLMMIEGEESYRNHPWPLLDEMSFLWNFVSHRNRPQLKLKNLSTKCESAKYPMPPEWIEASVDFNDCEDASGKSNFPDPTCVLIEEDEPLETNYEDCIPPRSKLRKLLENKEENNSDSPNENLTDSSYHLESHATVKVPQPIRLMDEEEYFCMSLAASLRRLPKQKSSLLKIKIMQILYDAQFGENKIDYQELLKILRFSCNVINAKTLWKRPNETFFETTKEERHSGINLIANPQNKCGHFGALGSDIAVLQIIICDLMNKIKELLIVQKNNATSTCSDHRFLLANCYFFRNFVKRLQRMNLLHSARYNSSQSSVSDGHSSNELGEICDSNK